MHRASVRLLSAALALALVAGVATAEPRGRGGGQQPFSAEQAAEQARKRYGGRVLDVRPHRPNGTGDGYRVKLLDRGEVRSVVIPYGPDKGRGRGKGRARPGR